MIHYLDFQFSSAHFYRQDQWTPERNREVFGACYDPHGHGHNYRLVVGFRDLPDDQREYVRSQIQPIIKTLDHHHLNHEIPEFKNKVPTTENIALYIGEKIKATISGFQLSHIKLWEMDNLWAEVHYE